MRVYKEPMKCYCENAFENLNADLCHVELMTMHTYNVICQITLDKTKCIILCIHRST